MVPKVGKLSKTIVQPPNNKIETVSAVNKPRILSMILTKIKQTTLITRTEDYHWDICLKIDLKLTKFLVNMEVWTYDILDFYFYLLLDFLAWNHIQTYFILISLI